MLEAQWAIVVPSTLGLEVEQDATFGSLPKVVGLLMGSEEWMSSSAKIETLPT